MGAPTPASTTSHHRNDGPARPWLNGDEVGHHFDAWWPWARRVAKAKAAPHRSAKGARPRGKLGRNKTPPAGSRVATDASWEVPEQRLFAVTDALEALSAETGHSVPRLALAWLLKRPTISGVVIGARNAEQLRDNLEAAEVALTPEQVAALDRASAERPVYPYWHQRRTSSDRNPPAI